MEIGIVYAGARPVEMKCRVDEPSTVAQVIENSGILKLCPDIDLKSQKIGIYGKLVKLDSELRDGDRIEIYRRITRVLDEDDDDDDDD